MWVKKLNDIRNLKGERLTGDVRQKLEYFKDLFSGDDVFRFRQLCCNGFNAAVLFCDSMVNNEVLGECVIKPLLLCKKPQNVRSDEYLFKSVLFAGEISKTDQVLDLVRGILYGDTVILLDNDCLVVNTKGFRTRGINEPSDERILQGPREGFDETAMLNFVMLRRKLPTPDLKCEITNIGRRTDTKVFICYLESLVKKNILKDVKRRLKEIDIDGILDSNYINELIKGNRYSLFKSSGTTERPDIVAARLLEGRIAIIVDGTPVCITLPYLFQENFQSDEDYYLNFLVANIGRILRYICFFLSITVPAIYICLTNFFPALLPTSFVISISASRSGVPFPSFLEAVVLIFIFEILKETGIRMPQSLGHALSIVGGLVVGQAAVDAKIVSAPMLIVVALSGICGLMIPKLKGAIFYYRLFFALLSSLLGFFGLFFGVAIMLISILKMKSFTVDYTGSIKEFNANSLKDDYIRAPFWFLKTRPRELTNNTVRMREKE